MSVLICLFDADNLNTWTDKCLGYIEPSQKMLSNMTEIPIKYIMEIISTFAAKIPRVIFKWCL